MKVARSYKLPFLAFLGAPSPAGQSVLQPGDIVPDTVIIADNVPTGALE